jgi:DNA-binding NarL/FixJ family response regulator
VQRQIRVLIVDDHPVLRHGMAAVLRQEPGFNIVGEAADGSEALAKARELRPEVVLMDINMPRTNGLQAALRLQSEMPTAKVLMITVSEKDEDLMRAVKFGARGYLLKDSDPRDIVNAIHRVADGEAVFPPQMAARLLEEWKGGNDARPAPNEASELSAREAEVLALVSKGASNREIGGTLFISENTVRTHLKNILEKLHVKNRSEAAAYAARLGLGA